MSRIPAAVAGLLAVFLSVAAARAQDTGFGGKSCAEWLKVLASDKEPRKRQLALFVVAEKFGAAEAAVVPGLIAALQKDTSPEVRRGAAQAIARLGEDAKAAVPALGEALSQDKEGAVREAAAKALGGHLAPFAKVAVPTLAEALKDPHPGTRVAAAETLRDLGDEARPALRQLIDAAKDSAVDRFTRTYAVQILSRFKNDDAVIVPVIQGIFGTRDAPVGLREAAADGLGRLGSAAAGAAAALADVLKDARQSADLRRASALALGKVGADAKTAWPAVKVALTDKDAALRKQAIRLAGTFGKDEREVVPALIGRCKDLDLEARLAAIQELGHLEAAAKEAVPALEALARDDSQSAVRKDAEAALKKIKGTP